MCILWLDKTFKVHVCSRSHPVNQDTPEEQCNLVKRDDRPECHKR